MHGWVWLLLLPVVVLATGVVYQRLGALKDRRRYLGLGRLVDIGEGRRLYLAQMGAGGPTVVLESGIAATSQNWLLLQRSVSGFARAVSYDRAGLGWSSRSATERTPSNIVEELRLMLQRAHIPPPYVLVGHSFGGLVVRRFAAEHPEDVVGVVLLDAMRTADWPPVNTSQSSMVERGTKLTAIAVQVARFGLARLATTSLLCRSGRTSRAFSRAAGAGGQHVLDRITCEVGKMPREVWPIVAAHWSSPDFYHGLAAHLDAIPATVREMHDAAPIVGIPTVLLTAGTAEPLSDEAMRQIGPEARQVIAENSGHWVHLDEHDLVLATIRSMVDEVRVNAPEMVEEGEANKSRSESRSFRRRRLLLVSALRDRFFVACEKD